ncbi:hypothetical protein NIES2100_05540 [Calothrix sp. NIES-2100]|uniref:hypothetical protein n=1 Tax=Calothrix sp. NIES-2100 TaxID=1954172 RepID=UPI000B613151|nr:hypothetical protein NIES2100_05540 [Calothrix sp. NIES-2100]
MFIKITPEIEELFLDRVKTLLEQGETTQTVKTSQKKSVKSLYDEDGHEIPVEVTRSTNIDKQTTLNPTPNWVLQLVANSMTDQAAIEKLTRAGYIVINPAVVNEKESEKASGGLSAEAIFEIKSKLLGIDNA